MRTLTTTLVLLLLAALLPACNARWKVDAAADIIQYEKRWTEALQDKNTVALDRMLARDFRLVFVEPGSPAVSREEYIANTQRMTFDSLETGNINLRYAGRNVVTARMPMTFTNLRFDDNPIGDEYILTDTWVKRGPRWEPVQRISEDAKPAQSSN